MFWVEISLPKSITYLSKDESVPLSLCLFIEVLDFFLFPEELLRLANIGALFGFFLSLPAEAEDLYGKVYNKHLIFILPNETIS